ncbi:isochorismatase family protein [Aquihabitans sp. G128]|uniref:cysteine hydrolase family protein n=1 Tax=Aquihabitans sp. G128 TaxID=2849779 RepID=UPI001C2397CF|nr:isochorismatase family protein [Aquihabitans sp. G128]QXC60356.1 isochorismatase family protein [Aquihabitans sp. G128]
MNRALLVIDVQNSFTVRPYWPWCSNPGIVEQVRPLVDRYRETGDLVVWILHTEPGTGGPFEPGSPHVALMDGLEPRAGEPVLVKTSRNAFTTTNLAQLLTERGVTRLAVTGIQTEQCCETTTRLAADLGYAVDFVIDATATFPIPHRAAVADRPFAEVAADPTTLGVQDVLARTEYALAGRFATITTVEEHLAS